MNLKQYPPDEIPPLVPGLPPKRAFDPASLVDRDSPELAQRDSDDRHAWDGMSYGGTD